MKELADLVGGPGELTRLSKLSRRTIGNYLSGSTEPGRGELLALAEAGDVSLQWLASGRGAMKDSAAASTEGRLQAHSAALREDMKVAEFGGRYNVALGPEIKGRVPLINWVQAGDFAQVVDNLHPGRADEWVETTVPIHQHTYALRVRGDSMTNPNGDPSFPDGSIIVVEPDAIGDLARTVNSFVIVKRTSDGEATFKQLVKDAGRYYLKPLNPRYPVLDLREDDIFCGVVREKVMRFF